MSAEILCIGTELLLGNITNGNARWLAEQLAGQPEHHGGFAAKGFTGTNQQGGGHRVNLAGAQLVGI